MKFISTRNAEITFDFETAIHSGYAKDGGLYVPKDIPTLSQKELEELSQLSYKDLVVNLLSKFIVEDEVPKEELKIMAEKVFSRFSHPDVATLVELKDGLKVAEFFHGPSRTFKDMSTFVCAEIFSYLLSKKNEKAIILIATHGDTGNSVIEAFLGMKNINVIVWYPEEHSNKIQKLKMCTVIDDRIHCVSARGSPDDIEIQVKKIFADKEFVQKYNVLSLNSINVMRVILQSVMYFFIYGEQMKKCPSKNFEIVVPVGAAGCLSGGSLAKKMGLPIELVAATTVNDIVCRTLKYGDLSVSDKVIKTISPAMDTQVPYNIERVLYFASEEIEDLTDVMEKFYDKGKAVLHESIHKKVRNLISSFSATDEVIVKTMRRCFEENNYKICPHTSTAASYHYHQLDNNLDDGRVHICIATASPARFPESLMAARVEPVKDPGFENLTDLPTKFEIALPEDNWEEMMREKIKILRQL